MAIQLFLQGPKMQTQAFTEQVRTKRNQKHALVHVLHNKKVLSWLEKIESCFDAARILKLKLHVCVSCQMSQSSDVPFYTKLQKKYC